MLPPAGKEWTDFVHREDELVTVVSGETLSTALGCTIAAYAGSC